MINSEKYSVGSEDGKSIAFQKEEDTFVGLYVTIKFKYMIVSIICVAAIISGISYYNSIDPKQNMVQVQDIINQNEVKSPIDDEGFVFGKSSCEVFLEEMALDLSDDGTIGFQKLLRMAILHKCQAFSKISPNKCNSSALP